MGWVEEKREGKRERGGEREEKGARGRTKGSKHFSLKYMKHKNIKCSCHYIRVVTI